MNYVIGDKVERDGIKYVAVYDNTVYCNRCAFHNNLLTDLCTECPPLKIIWIKYETR